MHSNEFERNNEYLKLLRVRKLFLIIFLICMPSALVILYFVFNFFVGEVFANLMIIILALLFVLFSSVFFLSKDICPWCGNNFFIKDYGSFSVDIFLRKKCCNCGMPKKVNK